MLEQRIEELTAAVKALTEVFTLVKAEAESKPQQARVITKGILAGATIVEELPNAKSEETPQSTSPASEPTETESAPVTYDDVKKVTIAVSKISKDKAVAGLAEFGVASAKQLVEAQWAAYVERMTAILGE
jgi:hypothetical protein